MVYDKAFVNCQYYDDYVLKEVEPNNIQESSSTQEFKPLGQFTAEGIIQETLWRGAWVAH